MRRIAVVLGLIGLVACGGESDTPGEASAGGTGGVGGSSAAGTAGSTTAGTAGGGGSDPAGAGGSNPAGAGGSDPAGAGGSDPAGAGGSDPAGAGGSGPAGAGGSGGATGGLPCEIQDLLQKRCASCHGEPTQFGAPMPLVTREHLMAPSPSQPVQSSAERSIARMKDDTNPMPQPPNERATEAEIAALEAWVKAGMPASDEACGSGGSGGASGSGGSGGSGPVPACVPDAVVKASTPWTIKKSDADKYVCFGGKIKATGKKRHITQVSADIDNKTHAHHLCIYDMGTKQVSGDPKECSPAGAATQGKLLYCWAPGADANVLPPEAGFPVAADQDTNILIEMHYSNIQGLPDSTDLSAATFCTTDQLRTYDADVMAFGSPQFSLPPAQSTTVESTITVPSQIVPDGWLHVIRGWPHMHLLGKSLTTEVFRDGKLVGDLGSTVNYSFNNQVSYPVDFKLQPQDTVVTKCVFNNNTSNTVTFGENTESEMCYNFVTYYPRITQPGWVWAAPGYLAKNKTYPTP